jgi:hypothetical protein
MKEEYDLSFPDIVTDVLYLSKKSRLRITSHMVMRDLLFFLLR